MGFEEEIKGIPQDLEGIVKGDVSVGKLKIPKVAIAAVVIGGVAIFGYMNRNKTSNAGSTNEDGSPNTGSFGTSQGDASTSTPTGGSTDSGTTPIDAGTNPFVNSGFTGLGGVGGDLLDNYTNKNTSEDKGFTLPSLPDFNNGSGYGLPSIPSFDNSQVPYLSYGDSGQFSSPLQPTAQGIAPAYSPTPITPNPLKTVISSIGVGVKGVGNAAGFAGTPAKASVQNSTGSNGGVANLLKGSQSMVKPVANSTVHVVNSSVGGASSFLGAALSKPVASSPKAAVQAIQQSLKPISTVASYFTNFFTPKPYVAPKPVPVYHAPVYTPPVYHAPTSYFGGYNYNPVPVPKVNNSVASIFRSVTHIGGV